MEAPGHTLPPGPWVNRIRLPQRREHSNSVPPSSRGPSLPPSRHECPTLPEVGHPWTRPSQMPNETLTRLPAESQSGHLRLERRREGHSPPPVPPDVPLADESIPRRPREAGAVASKHVGLPSELLFAWLWRLTRGSSSFAPVTVKLRLRAQDRGRVLPDHFHK